jgi:hypothetical protein
MALNTALNGDYGIPDQLNACTMQAVKHIRPHREETKLVIPVRVDIGIPSSLPGRVRPDPTTRANSVRFAQQHPGQPGPP